MESNIVIWSKCVIVHLVCYCLHHKQCGKYIGLPDKWGRLVTHIRVEIYWKNFHTEKIITAGKWPNVKTRERPIIEGWLYSWKGPCNFEKRVLHLLGWCLIWEVLWYNLFRWALSKLTEFFYAICKTYQLALSLHTIPVIRISGLVE